MLRILGTIAIYAAVFFGYVLIMNFVFPDGIHPEQRSGIAGLGLFWMVVLTFVLEVHEGKQGVRNDIIDAVSDSVESIKWPKLKLPQWLKPKPKPKNEMFANVTKPSTILANMIATGIMRNPEKATSSGSYAEWSRNNIEVHYARNRGISSSGPSVVVTVGEKDVNLDAEETKVLIAAMEFVITWHAEKREADLEADNQLKALEGIEYLMDISEKNTA